MSVRKTYHEELAEYLEEQDARRPRFIVTAWHGESRSIFYVVDTRAHEDDQPCIVASPIDRGIADRVADSYNQASR
jgi:hypothetical protein